MVVRHINLHTLLLAVSVHILLHCVKYSPIFEDQLKKWYGARRPGCVAPVGDAEFPEWSRKSRYLMYGTGQ